MPSKFQKRTRHRDGYRHKDPSYMTPAEYEAHVKRLEQIDEHQQRVERFQKAVKAANHKPGDIHTAPDGVRYQVRPDGSWKKLPPVIDAAPALSS